MMSHWRAAARDLLLLGLGTAAIFLLTFRAPVSYANGDPRYGLTVSVALLEQGTIRLDDYRERTAPPLPEDDYRFWESNGHLYHAFPLGTPLFATPAVAIAQWLGRDMLDIAEQNRITNGLAALSTGVIFSLLYGLARIYLRPRAAFPLAFLFVLGTSLISSLGAALWSHHGAVIAALLVLILLAAAERQLIPRVPGVAVGVLLFLAYLFRPAQSPFIALTLIYLGHRAYRRGHWRSFLGAAGASGTLLLLFLIFSHREFGTWFPSYYAPERAGDFVDDGVLRALYGLLFSPGRGLFIFSPLLLLLPLGTLRFRSHIRFRALHGLVMAWLPLQLLLLVSGAVVWWGGWSYGPRLLSDVLPGLFLWLVLLWHDVVPTLSRAHKVSWGTALGLLTAVSAVLHAGVGLYNPQVQHWNGTVPPNVDEHPEYLLDWRYPQFLASLEQLCARNAAFVAARNANDPPPPLELDGEWSDDPFRYQGWSWPPATNGVRRSQCPEVHIYFRTTEQRPWDDSASSLLLGLDASVVHQSDRRFVPVAINGEEIDTWFIHQTSAARFTAIVPPHTLDPGAINRMTLRIPDAEEPLMIDGVNRERGIILHDVVVDLLYD